MSHGSEPEYLTSKLIEPATVFCAFELYQNCYTVCNLNPVALAQVVRASQFLKCTGLFLVLSTLKCSPREFNLEV